MNPPTRAQPDPRRKVKRAEAWTQLPLSLDEAQDMFDAWVAGYRAGYVVGRHDAQQFIAARRAGTVRDG